MGFAVLRRPGGGGDLLIQPPPLTRSVKLTRSIWRHLCGDRSTWLARRTCHLHSGHTDFPVPTRCAHPDVRKFNTPIQIARWHFAFSHPSLAICESGLRKTQPSHAFRKAVFSEFAPLPYNLRDTIVKNATPLMQFEGQDFAHLHPSCATGDFRRLDVCPSHII